jgi:hypothetical protein
MVPVTLLAAKVTLPPESVPFMVMISVAVGEAAAPAISVRLPPDVIDAPPLTVIGLCAVILKVPSELSAPFTMMPPVLSITVFDRIRQRIDDEWREGVIR